jgi:hypothetical protein
MWGVLQADFVGRTRCSGPAHYHFIDVLMV